jgi:hypothetical protein
MIQFKSSDDVFKNQDNENHLSAVVLLKLNHFRRNLVTYAEKSTDKKLRADRRNFG